MSVNLVCTTAAVMLSVLTLKGATIAHVLKDTQAMATPAVYNLIRLWPLCSIFYLVSSIYTYSDQKFYSCITPSE